MELRPKDGESNVAVSSPEGTPAALDTEMTNKTTDTTPAPAKTDEGGEACRQGFLRAVYDRRKRLVPTLVIVGFILAFILVFTGMMRNEFRAEHVDNIELGFSRLQVREELGDPHEQEADTWRWFSRPYTRILDKIKIVEDELKKIPMTPTAGQEGMSEEARELTKELEELRDKLAHVEHARIEIRFNSRQRVEEVTFSQYYIEAEPEKAEYIVDRVKIVPNKVPIFTDLFEEDMAVRLYCRNGSYRMQYIVVPGLDVINTNEVGQYAVDFDTAWGHQWGYVDVEDGISAGMTINGQVDENIKYTLAFLDGGRAEEIPPCSLVITGKGVLEGEKLQDVISRFSPYIKRVVIGAGITSVEGDPFRNFLTLERITLSDTVMHISEAVLDHPAFPLGELYLGDVLYRYCGYAAGGIEVHRGTTAIYEGAFAGQTDVTYISIPPSVTYIGRGAFAGCTGEISFTTSEASALAFDDGWLDGFEGKVTWNRHNMVTHEDWEFFGYVDGVAYLTRYKGSGGDVVIPTVVGARADFAGYRVVSFGNVLAGNETITSVTIPSGIENIDPTAFYGCTALTSVTVGEDVVSIGDRAFENCSSLMSISLPGGIARIGSRAFASCRALSEIHYAGSYAAWKNIEKGARWWDVLTGEFVIKCQETFVTRDGA